MINMSTIKPRSALRTALASLFLASVAFSSSSVQAQASFGYLPDETAPHEGT